MDGVHRGKDSSNTKPKENRLKTERYYKFIIAFSLRLALAFFICNMQCVLMICFFFLFLFSSVSPLFCLSFTNLYTYVDWVFCNSNRIKNGLIGVLTAHCSHLNIHSDLWYYSSRKLDWNELIERIIWMRNTRESRR